MTDTELLNLLEHIQRVRSESTTLEIKAARQGALDKIYDTISAFANQDDGGVIVFGVDESEGFTECGVFDAQSLQKRIVEQCSEMEPPLRPVITVASKDGRAFVAAEIAGLEMYERPCFRASKGRLRGSYIRVGDADEPMTEMEIYNFDVMRTRRSDETREIDDISENAISESALADYLARLKSDRPNLARLDDAQILELMRMTRGGHPTLASLMLFGHFPQVTLPQLCVTAVVVPGSEIGAVGTSGERFVDNKRIEGTLPQMAAEAVAFVRRNNRTSTIIDKESGQRADRYDFPLTALREAVLNALIHRDYSIHTERMPVRVAIFDDRLEVSSPGGLFGHTRAETLGVEQPDTRNPIIAAAMELLGETENRYSGIPTMRRELAEADMPPPEFVNRRGTFTVIFRKTKTLSETNIPNEREAKLLDFCRTPRSRQEIAAFLGISSIAYAIRSHVVPLIERGLIEMTIPETPRSREQRFRARG